MKYSGILYQHGVDLLDSPFVPESFIRIWCSSAQMDWLNCLYCTLCRTI